MPKYRLHVDEVVNRLNFLDIETDLNERELDALLTKIEKDEITSTSSLERKLEAQGVKVKSVSLNNKSFYRNAEVLEIEGLEEPQKIGFMIQCKACDLNKENIEQAMEAAREKMNISIEENGKKAETTIQLSQNLDDLIVNYMRKQTWES